MDVDRFVRMKLVEMQQQQVVDSLNSFVVSVMAADWCCTVECSRSTQVIEQQDIGEFDTVGTVEAADSRVDFVMDSFVGRMMCCWCQLEGATGLLVGEPGQLVKVLAEDGSSR